MEALLLAAGLGTRLRPLTDCRPKALVEVGSRPLLEINIKRLIEQGVDHIVVNVHHFAEQIVAFLESRQWAVPVSVSDESERLLDTGGALRKAAPLFSTAGPYLIYNVDVLSRFSLADMLDCHLKRRALATLAVSQRASSRQLLFNADYHLVGWHNNISDEYLWSDKQYAEYMPFAFSGVAVVDASLIPLLPSKDSFPIVPEYVRLAKQHTINSFVHAASDWLDVGKPQTLMHAESFLNG